MKRKSKIRSKASSQLDPELQKRQKTGEDDQKDAVEQPNILQTMLEAMPDSNYKMQ